MNKNKVIAATFKTSKAIQKELAWWVYVCPELNPSVVKVDGVYHVVRDVSPKDHINIKTIQVSS